MALQITSASTIEEVINQLDRIIEWSVSDADRIGYFACLYRKVTLAVQEGIRAGAFEDGPRMERLDVIFANRFLDAFQTYRTSGACSGSWLLAFEQAQVWRPIVLQHLMLGMNAHINLDLGVAAAETMRGKPIEGIKNDFNQINELLLNLIDDFQDQLGNIFPLLKRIDLIGRFDEILAGIGIEQTRNQAWSIAQAFAGTPENEWEDKVRELDQKILKAGHRILQPSNGLLIQIGLFIIRLGEYHSVPQKIMLLK